jgi:hypothetical protein
MIEEVASVSASVGVSGIEEAGRARKCSTFNVQRLAVL